VRVVLGLLLLVSPILSLGIKSFSNTLIGHGTTNGEVVASLTATAFPFALGVYVIVGPSRWSKKAHLVFAGVAVFLLAVLALAALGDLSSVDVGSMTVVSVLFAAVYLSIIGGGYFGRDNKPPDEDFWKWLDESKRR
jgi:peptidoglycan/LPS O-acetylase OafA/YrhL